MGANEKHQAAYHGVLSDDTVRGRYCDGTYAQTGHTTDGEEYDAWLAGVKAEALEEAAGEIGRIDDNGDAALWIDQESHYLPVSDWLRDRAEQHRGGV